MKKLLVEHTIFFIAPSNILSSRYTCAIWGKNSQYKLNQHCVKKFVRNSCRIFFHADASTEVTSPEKAKPSGRDLVDIVDISSDDDVADEDFLPDID